MLARGLGSLILFGLLGACASVPPLLPRAADSSYVQVLKLDKQQTAGSAVEGQVMAWHAGWRGDHEEAIRAFDSATNDHPWRGKEPDLSQDHVEDALAAIVREAAQRQVVILNEAHHVSEHRAFAMRLAHELRKLGYDILACEAFTPDADLNMGPLTMSSGQHLKDPVFAEFIREARGDGWTLTSYEELTPWDDPLPLLDRVRRREQVQAQHLLERIFAKNPKAKVFIYAGYGHADKRLEAKKNPLMMAGELKRLTGIDPLTIDQSGMFAHADPARETNGYRVALAQAPASDSPFVLKKPGEGYRVLDIASGAYDMQVFHRPVSVIQGRADWLVNLAQRRPYPIPEAWLPTSGHRVIYAQHEGDPANALPADIVVVEAGKPAPALMLPAGQYRFEFEDEPASSP